MKNIGKQIGQQIGAKHRHEQQHRWSNHNSSNTTTARIINTRLLELEGKFTTYTHSYRCVTSCSTQTQSADKQREALESVDGDLDH